MNWEIKCSQGSGRTVTPQMVLAEQGGGGGKYFKKLIKFSLKIARYSLLKIIKLKMSGSNKKNDIIIKNMHSYVCFWFLLGQE